MATPVIMPKLEMSQESATVVEWLKQEGAEVQKGEALLTVETDKVTIDIESPASGVLAGIRVKADDVVPVTETIAYVLQPGETLSAEMSRRLPRTTATPVARRIAVEHGLDLSALVGTGTGGKVTRADVEAAVAQMLHQGSSTGGPKVRATPAARRMARERGVDVSDIVGGGPRGRVQAADVAACTRVETSAKASPVTGAQVIPLAGMRRRIAERMTASYQTTPHITLTVEVDMSAVQALRAELNARA
jgi:pyruvate dehydrogenase E2 component (dihydrolipoamide acetyltransferase)